MIVTQVARRFVREEWGGTETAILETSQRLLKVGHDTSILCPNALAATDREEMSGVEVCRKPYFYPYLGLRDDARSQLDYKGGNLFSFSLWRHLAKQRGLDLIHAHTGKRLGGIVRHTAQKRGIPYVVTLHGGIHDVPTGQMQQLAEPTIGAVEWGKFLGWWVGSRRVLDDASSILCVGQREQELTQERYPNKRVLYFPNGVSPARYAHGDRAAFREKYGIPEDAFLVVMVGRLDPQKNQAMAIEAVRQLREKHPNLFLLMIGHVTDQNYRTELQFQIDRSACPGRMALIPGLDPSTNALVDAYHAADLFVLPSNHEPFGIVILEAWAAGLHHMSLKTGNQAHCDITEIQVAQQFLRLLDDADVKMTMFVSGRSFVEEWDDLHSICDSPLIELGGHNYNCFTPELWHRFWNKMCGSYNGPAWYQRWEVNKTMGIIENKTGRRIRAWRNHMYMHGPYTERVLADCGIDVCSDGVVRQSNGPRWDSRGVFDLPLNIMPDHEHLFHAERTPEWVDWWVKRYGWSDDYGSDSYFVEEWADRVLDELRAHERDGVVSNMIIHPITMYLCDKFRAFERILDYIAGCETVHVSDLISHAQLQSNGSGRPNSTGANSTGACEATDSNNQEPTQPEELSLL